MHTAVWQRLESPPPRGEQSTQVETDRLYLESSPRVRGTGALVDLHKLAHGIIPAYAGNITRRTAGSSCGRDHPRMCGEQLVCCRIVTKGEGSSPRVRGAVAVVKQKFAGSGIIPACAGSSWPSSPSISATRDHPRVCGEQDAVAGSVSYGAGSSPRVRGAVPEGHRPRQGPGIIPACAGSSATISLPPLGVWDHPRVCGEQDAPDRARLGAKGSSPRVRGAGDFSHKGNSRIGIIPARAGSSRRPFR